MNKITIIITRRIMHTHKFDIFDVWQWQTIVWSSRSSSDDIRTMRRMIHTLLNLCCNEKLYRTDGNYIAYSRCGSEQSSIETKYKCEVLFCSGFMSDMSGKKSKFLQDTGIREQFTTTTFDYFGHGLSSGEFTKGSVSIWLDDVLTVIDEITSGPLILIGSSMGGWLMNIAAMQR